MLVALFVLAIVATTAAGFFGILNALFGNGWLAVTLIALCIGGIVGCVALGTRYDHQVRAACDSVGGTRIDSKCVIVFDGQLLEVKP